MAHDYIKEHPNQTLPDLRNDTALIFGAHTLLDNPDNWRRAMRDPFTWANSVKTAETSGLDKNKDSIITPAEMYEFINDTSKSTLAREAVKLVRENYNGSVSASFFDSLRFACILGIMPPDKNATADYTLAHSANKEGQKHPGAAGISAGLGALAAGTAAANSEQSFFSAIAAAGAQLLKSLPDDMKKGSSAGGETKAGQHGSNLSQIPELFDPKGTDLKTFNDYLKKHGG